MSEYYYATDPYGEEVMDSEDEVFDMLLDGIPQAEWPPAPDLELTAYCFKPLRYTMDEIPDPLENLICYLDDDLGLDDATTPTIAMQKAADNLRKVVAAEYKYFRIVSHPEGNITVNAWEWARTEGERGCDE